MNIVGSLLFVTYETDLDSREATRALSRSSTVHCLPAIGSMFYTVFFTVADEDQEAARIITHEHCSHECRNSLSVAQGCVVCIFNVVEATAQILPFALLLEWAFQLNTMSYIILRLSSWLCRRTNESPRGFDEIHRAVSSSQDGL